MPASLSVVDGKLSRNTLKRRGHFGGREVLEQRKHLEPDELQRFFRHMPKTSVWYSYFYIQYIYGCRLSEPALILDEDVSFKEAQIIIKRLKKIENRDEGGYKEHVYSADERVLEAVRNAQRWKVHNKDTDNPFLFPSKREMKKTGAERLSQLRHLDGFNAVSRFTAHRAFTQIAQEVKLPAKLQHSHVLRHTRATLLLASGVDIRQVQFLLGHTSIKMTERYVGVAASMREKVNAEVLQQGVAL
jgi:integrase